MTNFTFSLQHLYRFVIACCFLSTLGLSPNQLKAQCALGCNGSIQVSLDVSCEAVITPDMVISDYDPTIPGSPACPGGVYEVIIQDTNGNDMLLPLDPNGYPIVDESLIGYPAYVKVYDTVSGNSCWGNLTVEDKIPPVLDCQVQPADIYCYELGQFSPVLENSCIDLTVHPTLSNAVLLMDGATTMNTHDAVRRIEIVSLGCNSNQVSFQYNPRPTGSYTEEFGVNVKLFYYNGSTWDELANLDYEGTAGSNNIAPLIGSWNSFTYNHTLNLYDGEGATNYYRVAIIDKAGLDDEMVGNYGCEDCGTVASNDRHFDNADVAFEIPAICSNVTIEMIYENITVNDCADPGISADILKTVEQTYVATDGSGNESAPCTYTFNVLRHPMSAVQGPQNYFNDNGAAFTCGDFEYDAHGNPIIDPAITGVPYFDLNGNMVYNASDIPLYPAPELYCNVVATYSDTYVNINCVLKVIRTWNVVEWNCDPRQYAPITQMIEIADNEIPTIDQLADITVSSNIAMDYNHPSTGQVNCGAMTNLPAASIYDNCDDDAELHVTINVTTITGDPVDFVDGNGGLVSVPLGHYYVTYTVRDQCYNEAEMTYKIYVQDLTAPVMICDQNTVVSLNNTTEGTHVYVDVLDEGSYDDCQLSRVVGRRMDADPDDCECPVGLYGFHYLGRLGAKDYYMSKHDYTAHKAKSEAHALEGNVVYWTSAGERKFVYDQVRHYVNNQPVCFWTGFKRQYDDTFDPSPIANDWSAGNPNMDGDCVVACVTGVSNNQTLSSASCEDILTSMPYVLEMPVCGFSDAIAFCCDDAGEQNTVVMRAIDANCNFNDCMVDVEVQDKNVPIIFCPDDITISCDDTYDLTNLTPFGEAYISTGCGGSMTELDPVETVNQCHEGTILRTFSATSSGGATATCHQHITIEPNDPFVIDCDNPDSPNDDVIWPKDVFLFTGCADPESEAYHPDAIEALYPGDGYPEFLYGNACNLIAANWEDQIFTFNPNIDETCFKIVRTWTVIDWCNYNAGHYYTCSYTQVIKLTNTEAPYFVDANGDEIDCVGSKAPVCTYDPDCQDGFIELTAQAFDECSLTNLTWEYEIDANYNGSFDADITNNGHGALINASGNYPIGNHLIRYTFYDQCGNQISCDQEFSIVNCVKPTPYCLNGLAVDLGFYVDPISGDTIPQVKLWASDFDQGSFHPCGYDVVAHFDPNDLLDTGIVFTCEDFGNDTIMVYFTAVDYQDNVILDENGDPLQAFCLTYANIQDNQGLCDDFGNKFAIGGSVITETNELISEVMVDLSGSLADLEMTDNVGEYAFDDMPEGNNYDVVPFKDDDHLNGVSTLDIVMIQRHVLGLDILNSPYKTLAADVNKDDSVSAIDVVELRKMILGIYDEFPNNDSWRFIDAQFEFVDNNPFDEAFPEIYSITNLSTDMEVDFVGFKIGDVNNSVTSSITGVSTETRSAQQFGLEYQVDGNKVIFFADNSYDLVGMQFAMNLPNNIQVKSIESGMFDVTSANIGTKQHGVMTFSWNELNAIGLDSEEVLFTLILDESISDKDLSLSSDFTQSEAYGQNLEILDIEISPRDGMGEYALYQNVPNPFVDNTNIEFRIPSDMNVELTIYDVSGKLVRQLTGNYTAGNNVITIDSEGLSGVHYYTIKAEQFTATKKMVVLK